MPREITDRGRVVEAVKHLSLTAELFEEQNGKQKYGSDLEVIVQGKRLWQRQTSWSIYPAPHIRRR